MKSPFQGSDDHRQAAEHHERRKQNEQPTECRLGIALMSAFQHTVLRVGWRTLPRQHFKNGDRNGRNDEEHSCNSRNSDCWRAMVSGYDPVRSESHIVPLSHGHAVEKSRHRIAALTKGDAFANDYRMAEAYH